MRTRHRHACFLQSTQGPSKVSSVPCNPTSPSRALRGAIARFVSLRRHEALTLHDAVQGMSPRGFDWLPGRFTGGKVVASSQQLHMARRPLRPAQECHSSHFLGLQVPTLPFSLASSTTALVGFVPQSLVIWRQCSRSTRMVEPPLHKAIMVSFPLLTCHLPCRGSPSGAAATRRSSASCGNGGGGGGGGRKARAPYGAPPSRHAADQRLVCCWVRWVLRDMVVPLLRTHFYVTESEPYKQQVGRRWGFYRRGEGRGTQSRAGIS